MSTDAVTPLRQRMIEDMSARKLGAHSQRSHIYSCKRFAGFLKRSPDTAMPDANLGGAFKFYRWPVSKTLFLHFMNSE